MIQNPNPVLVAVGHDPVEAALVYAAQEAKRQWCGLHLVHVVHAVAQGPEMMLVEATDAEAIGRRVLEGAREHARDVLGDDLPVTSELVVGAVVPSLVAAAAGSRSLVLQHRVLGRVRRIVTRSVTGGVAARTAVPVVAVPSDWTERPDHRWVTVGVDDLGCADHLLSAALAAAGRRSTGLRVVHAFDFPSAYDDIAITPAELATWTERTRGEIHARLAALSGEADLRVQVVVERARAAEAILRASEDSALLVLGRHDPRLPMGSHLGPVARAVLRETRCPLLLARPEPPARERRPG